MTQIVVTGGSGKAGRAVVHDLVEHGYDVVNVDVVPAEPAGGAFPSGGPDGPRRDDRGASRGRRGRPPGGHPGAQDPDRRADVRDQHPQHLQRLQRRDAARTAARRVGLERDRARPAVRSSPCPQPPRSGGRTRASPRAGLRADRRGAPASAAFELLALQGPRRGDGSPVRALERDPVHRSALLRDPRACRVRVVPGRAGTTRTWANGTSGAYVDARDVGQACRLGLTAEITGAEVFIIAAGDTVMDRPNAELLAACFPSVPLRPGIGDFDTLLSIDKARRVLGYDPGLLVARRRRGAESAPDRAAASGASRWRSSPPPSTNLFIGSEACAPPGGPRRRCAGRTAGSRARPRQHRGRRLRTRGAGHDRAARAGRGSAARDRGRRRRGSRRRRSCDAEAVVEEGSDAQRLPFEFVVAEPGWRMFMIAHFHYDPVWWNTQAAYTETWGAAIQYRVAVPGAGPGPRQGAPRDGPSRPRLQVRARRARLPQALLGRLPGGPRLHPTAPGRGAARVRRRHLQRAEHQPDERRVDDPERDLRDRLPARRARRRAGDRVAARCLRSRPAVPRDHGRRRGHVELVGARAVPRVGTELGPRTRSDADRRPGGRRAAADAVPDGVRLDRPERSGPADELHGRSLLGRLVDGRRADARGRRGGGPPAVHRAGRRLPRRRTCCCRSAPTTRRRTSG